MLYFLVSKIKLIFFDLEFEIYNLSDIKYSYNFYYLLISIYENLICVILMQIIMKDEGRNSNIEIN
jgi:fucose 4-O-acetylase-like acetyltransferase